jgi:signal transduction histidine kinase
MNFTGIHKRLIILSVSIISSALAFFIVIMLLMGSINSYRYYLHTKGFIENSLINKGMTLINNNSLALRSMAEDNSYSAIKDIVISTVLNDSTMLYGIYMDMESQPWVYATKQDTNKPGINAMKLTDTASFWAQNIVTPSYKYFGINKNVPSFIEFAAPVISGNDQKLGVIRYGISTIHLKNMILQEKKRLIIDQIVFCILLLITTMVIFVYAFIIVKKKTAAITSPIVELTKAAGNIAEGNYSIPIKSLSKDEIGMLAENFETMRSTIKDYTERLENKVTERTEQLKAAQKELIEKAHKAGMADIAAGTLHNVGNILNSIKASVEAINDIILDNQPAKFYKANTLLRENINRLDDFIHNDPRCKKLLMYYLKIEEPLKAGTDGISDNIMRIIEKINAVADVIAAQQTYAGIGGLSEKTNIVDIIEDMLLLQSSSIQRHHITIIKNYQDVPHIMIQKTKLIHILVNLIKNAKDSMVNIDKSQKNITISLYMENNNVVLRIKDSGCGIPSENITKIFSHGFTTKKNGHGFGLHSSANYMKEMGGKMWAESDGEGNGSSFYLLFPIVTMTEGKA